jgi:hypothetical protein
MVMQALQYLHGFDMTYRSSDHRLISHGLPGPYVRTLEQVAAEFDAWRTLCQLRRRSGWVGWRPDAMRLRSVDDNAGRGNDVL